MLPGQLYFLNGLHHLRIDVGDVAGMLAIQIRN